MRVEIIIGKRERRKRREEEEQQRGETQDDEERGRVVCFQRTGNNGCQSELGTELEGEEDGLYADGTARSDTRHA